MSNYENFRSGNYSCNNCTGNSYTMGYQGVMNSAFHGSYSGNTDSSMEKSCGFEY